MASDDYVNSVAQTVIAQIERGVSPWQKPWTPGGARYMPHNPTTGNSYRGGNAFWLLARQQELGTDDSRWLTYQQARGQGGQVRKGEKATAITILAAGGYEPAIDAAGRPKMGADGKQLKEWKTYERPRIFSANVFNASQIDGMPANEAVRAEAWERHQVAESILQNSGARVEHLAGDRAFYSTTTDSIVLPRREQFASADGYYAVALHEMGHWTGHESRLGRDLSHPFGSEGYAREELRAEIASLMLGDRLSLGHDPERHSSYLASWLKLLKDDPRELFRAARDADQIQSTLLGYARTQEQAATQEATQAPRPVYQKLSGEQAQAWHREQVALVLRDAESHEDEYLGMKRVGPAPAPGEAIYLDQSGNRVAPALGEVLHSQASNTPVRVGQEGVATSVVTPLPQGRTTKMEDPSQNSAAAALVVGQVISLAYEVDTATSRGVKHVSGTVEGVRPTVTKNIRYDIRPESNTVPVVVYSNQILEVAEPGHDLTVAESFEVKTPDVPSAYAQGTEQARQFLTVPFEERDEAYKLGARRDKEAKVWYIPEGVDPEPLQRWAPKTNPVSMAEVHEAAKTEFGNALRANGFLLDGDPIMDGKYHRVKIEGDRGAAKNGSYAGHLDTRPGGVMKNHKSGVVTNWSATKKMVALSAADRARLDAEATARRVARDNAQAQLYASRAAVAERLWAAGRAASDDHPYAVKKGISVSGLRTVPPADTDLGPDSKVYIARNYADAKRIRQALEKAGQDQGAAVITQGDLMVDLRDAAGKLWSVQTIGNTGRKSYLTDAKKSGSMHTVGDVGLLKDPKTPIIVTEGYATGKTLSVASRSGDMPVFVAFDAGNLAAVASALVDKYPGRLTIIGGDNDHETAREVDERTGHLKPNRGLIDAQAAAKKVGGIAVVPKFAATEKGSDWNDLQSLHGIDAVREQFRGEAMAAIAHNKSVLIDQTRQPVAQQSRGQTVAEEQKQTQARGGRKRSV